MKTATLTQFLESIVWILVVSFLGWSILSFAPWYVSVSFTLITAGYLVYRLYRLWADDQVGEDKPWSTGAFYTACALVVGVIGWCITLIVMIMRR